MGKTIAIIPARGGSKRLPGKNIKSLNGKPLISYSIEYALANSAIIDEVYVSTDDLVIKETAEQLGAKVINRPAELSGDLEHTVTGMKHVLSVLENTIETVILLQPTNPLRPKLLLDEAFKAYLDNKVDSLFTVTRDHKKLGKIEGNTFQPFNYAIGQRSQDLEPLYFENGLLYITKASLIKKEIIFNEASLTFIVNHKFASVDIDTIEDFEYAEYILKTHHEG
ncbi:acylneuraminate cytidylyltransferase family protein [uncultured Winogradskyella sp.]|uniref:acylneuraminate cytidylyltransferase family protein n=1 Tax=uncultured Winogradskyella sp. TaxID=395353 RepID=UPI002608B75B|nr:acylneuraminate cytidylyltransferase family protein [uncultured Winogradskyella sp.]